MPEKPNGKLTYWDRRYIQDGIRANMSFGAIAAHLGVAKTTVSNEVKRNRTRESTSTLAQSRRNVCKNARSCKVMDVCNKGCLDKCPKCKLGRCNQVCPDFEEAECPKLDKPPYVCNECPGRFGLGCEYGYRFYDATLADERAKRRRTEARQGIDCSEAELKAAVQLIKPLLKKGQSIDHIWESHGKELPCSKRTFYRYIQQGVLSNLCNLDLPRKMRYKPRKKTRGEARVRPALSGRTYEDFTNLPLEVQMSAVEMDCVEGRRGEKPAILTLLFRRYHFQIMMLLPEKTQEEVAHALDLIEFLLGGDFPKYLGTILTDRGSEFLDYELLEKSVSGGSRCTVYYCDPMKSGQKGACEKNHVELRKILPKGTSFKNLVPRDIAIISSHVNSYTRPALGGVAPITLASQVLPAALIEGLGIESIPPDEVMLKPTLIMP